MRPIAIDVLKLLSWFASSAETAGKIEKPIGGQTGVRPDVLVWDARWRLLVNTISAAAAMRSYATSTAASGPVITADASCRTRKCLTVGVDWESVSRYSKNL